MVMLVNPNARQLYAIHRSWILSFLQKNNFKTNKKNMQLTSTTHFNHFVSERSTASPPENSGNLMFL